MANVKIPKRITAKRSEKNRKYQLTIKTILHADAPIILEFQPKFYLWHLYRIHSSLSYLFIDIQNINASILC